MFIFISFVASLTHQPFVLVSPVSEQNKQEKKYDLKNK